MPSTKGDPRNRRAYRKQRIAVLIRDNHQCYICHRDADQVDHVIPIARGGDPIDPENLKAICKLCNQRKGAGNGVFLVQSDTPLS